MKNSEVNLGGGSNLVIKACQMVTLKELLIVLDENKTIELDIDISADFNAIPKEYHEIFLNMMSAKYHSRASFGDNPFSQCQPISKKSWWQIWKR